MRPVTNDCATPFDVCKFDHSNEQISILPIHSFVSLWMCDEVRECKCTRQWNYQAHSQGLSSSLPQEQNKDSDKRFIGKDPDDSIFVSTNQGVSLSLLGAWRRENLRKRLIWNYRCGWICCSLHSICSFLRNTELLKHREGRGRKETYPSHIPCLYLVFALSPA